MCILSHQICGHLPKWPWKTHTLSNLRRSFQQVSGQKASDRCHVTIASASKAPCFRHNQPCHPNCLPETSGLVCSPQRQREDYDFGNVTELLEVQKMLDLQPASRPFSPSRKERKTKKTSEHSVNLARSHISDCLEE